MSRIEQELFGSSQFFVSKFEMEKGILSLTFVSCDDPKISVRARFLQFLRLEVERSSGDEGGFAVPWAVIGFDCDELYDHCWVFRLHTDAGEIEFSSDWPKIEKVVQQGRCTEPGDDVAVSKRTPSAPGR